MTAAQAVAKALDFNDEDDLYDAVLTGSVDKEKTFPSKQSKTEVKTDNNAKFNPPPETSQLTAPKKFGLYIGKFPWWVTEEDILLMINTAGVRDVIDVRFAENKVNGLSKGFVKVLVGSKESVKLLLDRVPKCTLGGEKILCRLASHSNLSYFEDMAKQSVPDFPPRAAFNMNDSGASFLPQDPFDSTVPQQFLNQFGNTVPSEPKPFLNYPPPPLPHMPPPSLLPFMFLNFMKSPHYPPPQDQNANTETASTSQEWRSSSTLNSDEKTDKDFEELINRNRAVASTAISKAVSGATTGDFKVAMETLLTAISIIKQSRVYQDDRCQAMVMSLKDCLVSIQGSCRHSEVKERDRRKSSSKERRRSSWGDRDRSRSSERRSGHSKERSRDRDRARYY